MTGTTVNVSWSVCIDQCLRAVSCSIAAVWQDPVVPASVTTTPPGPLATSTTTHSTRLRHSLQPRPENRNSWALSARRSANAQIIGDDEKEARRRQHLIVRQGVARRGGRPVTDAARAALSLRRRPLGGAPHFPAEQSGCERHSRCWATRADHSARRAATWPPAPGLSAVTAG